VLANSDDPQSSPREVARRAAALALGAPIPKFDEQALRLDQMSPLLGRYVDAKGSERLLFERGGKLWLATGDLPARQVRSAGGNRYFFGPDELVWFELDQDSAGQARMVVHVPETSEARILRRSGGVPVAASIDPAQQQRLMGTYLTETNVTVVIAASDGALTISQGAKPVGALRAVGNGQFAIDGTPMRVEFVYSGDRVTGLRLLRGARVLTAARQN
jgi:hypothetical protein